MYYNTEESESMQPQNMSLGHKDYCKLKTIEKKKTQDQLSALLFFTKKGWMILNHQTEL